MQPTQPQAESAASYWNRLLAPYMERSPKRALFQLVTTSALFILSWAAMVWSLDVSYWLTLALLLPTSGFLIRLFIFQHDCGHGAFFKSQRINNWVGFFIGILMLTPYQYWRRTHASHHASSGDLDRRGYGDVNTLTVDEYLALSKRGRLRYRIYRSITVLLLVGPIYQFVVKHRFPLDAPRSWKREWSSIMWTNVGIIVLLVLGWQTIGITKLLLVQVPLVMTSTAIGIWLFYVQHQFEDTYWRNTPEWDFHRAGLEGSSYYELPAVLHWFTGNIGYHHIHHLSSRIPNYHLRRCFREQPEMQKVTRLTIWESVKCARLKLWDQASGKLVGFSEIRQRPSLRTDH